MLRTVLLRSIPAAFGLLIAVGSPIAQAQSKGKPAAAPVRLSALIAAFLADSGVRTRGLPWTTGDQLGITWQSAGPVPNPDRSAAQRGVTLARIGTLRAIIDDSVTLPMTIAVSGAPTGLARVDLSFNSLEVTKKDRTGFFTTREMVEAGLRHDGVELKPIKCSREKEGASYGNLIDAVKTPGKTASGLWWAWDSPQQVFGLSMSILYRRADMTPIECYSG